MVNHVIFSLVNRARRMINALDFSDETITVDNCHLEPDSFAGPFSLILKSALESNITDVFLRGTQPQPPVLDPDDSDEQVEWDKKAATFNWKTSFLGEIVPNVVEQLNNDAVLPLLDVFANSSGDAISDIFFMEGDGSITMRLPLDEYLGFILPLDGIIDGGNLTFGTLVVKGVNKFNWDTLQLLNPQSTFVTEHRFEFNRGDGKISIELPLTLHVPAIFGAAGETQDRADGILFKVDLTKPELHAQTLIALNWDKVSAINV